MTYNLTLSSKFTTLLTVWWEEFLNGLYVWAKVVGLIYMTTAVLMTLARCFGVSPESFVAFSTRRPKLCAALILTSTAGLGWLILRNDKKRNNRK